MALTTELLDANAATSGLTEEQKNAIIEMSANDETSVIAKKTGEIYGGLDADILAASGIAKNGTEKTYDYAKRVIGEIKGQAGNAAELQKQVTDLTNEKSRLEGIIAKGGADAETKRQLEQTKNDLANMLNQFNDLQGKYDKVIADHAKEMFDSKLESEFAKATAGIKFKADLPASVTSVLMQQAISKVKGMNPEYIDDGNGGKILAFMENGAPRRNPGNNLRPYTASELVAAELKAMGVLDEGRKATGAGSGEGEGGGGSHETADLSGARTQDEAREILVKQFMGQGLVNGSKEMDAAIAKAWKENWDVLKTLPIR